MEPIEYDQEEIRQAINALSALELTADKRIQVVIVEGDDDADD